MSNQQTNAELFSPIVKRQINEGRNLSDTAQRRLTILSAGLLHGVMVALFQVASIIEWIPQNYWAIAITIFVISFPLGFLLNDFFKGIGVALLSILVWFVFSLVYLAFPALLGVVASPDLFVISYLSYLLSFLFFIPAPILFGISLGVIYAEFFS